MSGDRRQNWKVVSSSNPCPICGRGRKCEVSSNTGEVRCRRVEAGAERPLKNGSGWLHRIGGDHHEPLPYFPSSTPASSKASPDQLHKVYSALLSLLPLSPAHYKHLLSPKRQLTPEQIQRRGYRSLPTKGRARVVARLIDKLGGPEELAGVPGFFISRKGGAAGYWTLAGGEGLLVPVWDAWGRIVGFQIRNMDPQCKPDDRYRWLSSNPEKTNEEGGQKYPGGTGSGAVPHVARPAELKGPRVWVTEGPLKADISADRLGEVVVALPGVEVQDGLLEELRTIGAGAVVVAFDADKRRKPQVQKAEAKLLADLKAEGFEVLVADWDEAEGKGLDDLLLAGGAPALTPYSGPAAVATGGKRRKVEVIEGKPMPAGPYLSIKEAQNRNAALLREGLTRNERLFLASDTGTGKTTATMDAFLYHFELDLRAIGGPEDGEEDLRPRQTRRQALRRLTGKRRVNLLVDQKDQLEALRRDHPWLERGQREGWVAERWGRDETTCPRYGEVGEMMKAYGAKNQNIEQAFCVPCPERDQCPYQADKIKAAKALVVLGTKAAYAHAVDDLREFDAIVVDEGLGPLVYDEVPVSGKDLAGWLEHLPADAPARPLLEALREALEGFGCAKGEDYDELQLMPALRALLGAEGLRAAWQAAARQLRDEDGTLACERPGGLGVPLKAIGELVERIGAELDRPQGADTRIWLNWHREQREGGEKGARWPVVTIGRVREELLRVLQGRTFINLDATPAPEILSLFPGARIERVQIDPKTRITQVSDELLGKKTMTPAKREKLAMVVENWQREYFKKATFTRKGDQPAFQRLIPHHGVGWGYYGRDNRAVNDEAYSEAECMALIGLLQIPPGAVRRRVQALRDSPVPVALGPAEALTPYMGYQDEQGRGRARRRQIDPDPDVQRAIDHQVAADAIQTIGRLRAGLRDNGPVRVLVLSAYPLEGLRVDELVSLRELEGRQNNLESINTQRQARTRELVERELAVAREAGENLSQRELARRAGVSREGLREVLGKQADTNYGEWPTLRQKNIGEGKEVETIDPLLVQASVHSSQMPVSPEFPPPDKLIRIPFCSGLRTALVGQQRGELPARVAEWPEEWRGAYIERAGIMEFDGGLSRAEAERRAEELVREACRQGRVPAGVVVQEWGELVF